MTQTINANGIDICFNATSNDDVQGTPLLAMPFEDFVRPVTKAVTAHFNIATAVGRHMTRRGRGAILVMAAGREAIPRLGGAHRAWASLARLSRQLAPALERVGIVVNGPNPWDPQIHDQRFWNRLMAEGSLGLGEAYMDGWWDCADLAEFFNRILKGEIHKNLKITANHVWQLLQARVLNMQNIARSRRVAAMLKRRGRSRLRVRER